MEKIIGLKFKVHCDVKDIQDAEFRIKHRMEKTLLKANVYVITKCDETR